MTARETVVNYWRAMQSNDFEAASRWLTEDYELLWPQSSERLVGRANFVAVNSQYPASGRWEFAINSLLADGNQVVTDVSVTDGSVRARAITFSVVSDGLISRQVEYWPDDYPAPEWRAQWVTGAL